MNKSLLLAVTILLTACNPQSETSNSGAMNTIIPDVNTTTGSIEILSPKALEYIDTSEDITIHGNGYKWTEGPLWIDDESGGYLLFSDIPNNTIIKYQPNVGTSLYIDKSGATQLYKGDYSQGSNGLLLNTQNQLVLLQQGDRRLAIMDAPLSSPKNKFKTLASHFNDKRLNSPNDAVLHSDGSLYFTDPPYGLKDNMKDSRKELDFQGVYKLSSSGELTLLDDSVNYPNGIGLSKDEKTLYVAVSDEEHPLWLAYDLQNDGTATNKRIFYDAKAFIGVKGEQGMPDGMALHSSGNIFATGPGGVWLFTPEGEVLAKIRTGKLTANCTLSSDEKYLYMTAHDTVMSLKLK
jgi:gluconolactonase